MKKYSGALFALVLALIWTALHYYFGWRDFVSEQESHQQVATQSRYLDHYLSTFFENWQSEFIQLAFQFAILAGGLKWIKIHAHEEEMELVQSDLREIKLTLAGMVNK